MEITIHTYSNGQSYVLTTESPASHYGIPALRYTGCGCPDYGPGDRLCAHAYPQNLIDFFGPWTAADAVYTYVSSDDPSETRHAAQSFLAQWPEGPQL